MPRLRVTYDQAVHAFPENVEEEMETREIDTVADVCIDCYRNTNGYQDEDDVRPIAPAESLLGNPRVNGMLPGIKYDACRFRCADCNVLLGAEDEMEPEE